MNFPGVPGPGPHFHGAAPPVHNPIGHQGQDMMLEQGMMGGAEGFHGHDGAQNLGHPHHQLVNNVIPHDMDYRLLECRQASVTHMPISALSFDMQELLWAGTEQGHVSSYYGPAFEKYTAYHASPQDDPHPQIRQLLTVEEGVLALTHSRLRMNRRTAQTTHRIVDPDLHDMHCMIQTAQDSVLLGGGGSKMLEVNTKRGKVINKYPTFEDEGCNIFRHGGKFVCVGDATGKVVLYNEAMKKMNTLEPNRVLTDFDIQGNLLVTCGRSTRSGSLYVGANINMADRMLMVYDLRVMRAMAPIQVNIDPMFLRFVPSLPHHMVVVSQMGSFQLIETATMTHPSVMIFPVETRGAITSFDLSRSCQAMCFGDAAGFVHLYANSNQVVFSNLDIPTIFADHVDPPPVQMHLGDDLASLATVPMVWPTNEALLSDWPAHLMTKVYRRPKPNDPEIMRELKWVQNVGLAANPRKVRRNQAPYKLDKEDGTKRQLSVPESPIGRGEDPFKTVPKEYQRMLMKYTKLDDFDFRHYNKTNFAGLTAEHNNSYCNGLLQTLYFVEPLRAALLSHICQQEFCLACELGFLFHMLDTKKGEACQAKNFLRAFRTLSEAAALGLLLTESEEVKGQANLLTLIPTWHRFLIQQIDYETSQQMEASADTLTPTPTPPKEGGGDSETTMSSTSPDTSPDGASAAGAGGDKKTDTPNSSSKKKRKNKRSKKKEESSKAEATEKEGEEGSGEDSKAQEEQQEETTKMVEVSIVKDLFFLNTNFVLVCRCGVESLKDEQTKITILTYPPPPLPGSGEGQRKVSFGEVLHHSLTSESPMQTWCNECSRYTQHVKRRQVTSLPDIMAIDCNLTSENNLHFWREQIGILKQERVAAEASSTEATASSPAKNRTQCRYGDGCRRSDCRYWHSTDGYAADGGDRKETGTDPSWIPLGLRLKLSDNGNLSVQECSNEEPLPKDPAEQKEFYEVYAVVYVIEQPDAGRHLVSCIRVGEPYHLRKERVTCHQWYLFNDFCIEPIEKPEYITMDLSWKIPSVVYYSRRTYLKNHNNKVVNWCTKHDILYSDPGLVNRDSLQLTYLPLHWEEKLTKGDLVGLDAEFISLKEEEAELRSDGTKSTIKPSHVSPGRITCNRGQGEHFGQAFIDDYILTPEQVTDYLTEFSGIEPNELDPNTSTKHLTTLKSTYQKLRCLLDIGVIFVGHGLKKDFKVINLQVPKEQILDTVQLFHLPNKRYISLRFLAWFFLEKNIQSGQHDSAEDARIALLLYQRYQQLKAEGPEVVKSSILDLYDAGRKMAWKVPDMVSDQQTWTADHGDPAVWAEYEEDAMDRYQTFYDR